MSDKVVFPLRRSDPAYLPMLELRVEDVERRLLAARDMLGTALEVRGIDSDIILRRTIPDVYDELDEIMADDNGDIHRSSLEPRIKLEVVA